MGSPATSFHPPWAVLCWCDCSAIYIEIPTKAEPYITSFQLSEGGLTKALHYLRVIHKVKAGPRKINGTSKTHSLVQKLKPNAETRAKFTDEQHQAAKAVLKKMGLI